MLLCVWRERERWVSKCDTTSGLLATECGKEKEEKANGIMLIVLYFINHPLSVSHTSGQNMYDDTGQTRASKRPTDRPTTTLLVDSHRWTHSYNSYVCHNWPHRALDSKNGANGDRGTDNMKDMQHETQLTIAIDARWQRKTNGQWRRWRQRC